MKKKILYLVTKSNWGGAQRYVYDLATSLPKDQFDVTVVVGGDGLLKKKLEAEQIRALSIASMQRDISLFKEFATFFTLYQVFKKEKPDIVHLNSSKAGGLGALAARMTGIKKIIFTAHGWPFWENRNALSRALIYLFSWLTAILVDRVIVVSDYDLRVTKSMPGVGDKVVRIYNGIDSAMEFGSGEIIRNSFPYGAHITGTIGELNGNKNQIALIERAKREPDLNVAIVGEGENRVFLTDKINEYGLTNSVKMFGFHPADEVLKGFDTFALPSLKEGLPYVLLEARAAGLPIVANRVGGVGEILDSKDMVEFSLAHMLEKTLSVYRI